MRLQDIDHVLAAAAEVTGQDEFVVIGSQAILGSVSDPPQTLLASLEADIYPLRMPDAASAVDGALGDGSQFHLAYGYYAHGVGPETAKAPRGWEQRLVRRDVPPRVASPRRAVGWFLERHDLVLSKCAAGRERDWEYAEEAIRARLVEPALLLERCEQLPLEAQLIAHIKQMVHATIARATMSNPTGAERHGDSAIAVAPAASAARGNPAQQGRLA